MQTYHKIQSVFKRDPDTNYATFLEGQYSLPEFEYLANLPWEWTEKIDGTNIRILAYGDQTAQVGGRTDKAELHPDLLAHCSEVAKRVVATSDLYGLTLFGEGYGAGIQKGGGDYRSDKGFILFDVMVDGTGLWLDRENVEEIAGKISVPVVKVVGRGPLSLAITAVRDRRKETMSVLKDGLAEGLVCRPAVELRGRRGYRIITKIKVRDYPEGSTS